jgi:hypothetical protein
MKRPLWIWNSRNDWDSRLLCPICGSNIFSKSITINLFFLNLLEKYENEAGCVIELDGTHHLLSDEDKQIEYSLVNRQGFAEKDTQKLIKTIKTNLPMVISSLSYEC